jgi:hypothetical protein
MTHNIFKVGNIEPNANGALSISPNDLSDLGTYADGETLVFNATAQQWQGGAVPGGGANSATFGRGEADDYLNSGFTMTAGSTIGLYDTAPRNNIPAYVTFNKVAGTDWLDTITLQEGLYTLYASIGVIFSAAGVFSYQFRNSANAVLSSAGALPESSSYLGSTNYVIGRVSVTAPLDIRLRVLESSNVSETSQGTFLSTRSMLSIQRMQ